MSQLLIHSAFSQPVIKPEETFKFEARPDTILERNKFGYIYITTDTTARMYNWLAPNPQKDELDPYDYIKHIYEKYQQKPLVNNLKGFPKQWNNVHVYKDKFYVYSPSDWMGVNGYYVTDSAIYQANSDPWDLFLILGFKAVSKVINEISIINYAGEREIIQVQLLEPKYGIYVWTFMNQQNKNVTRQLLQDSRFTKRLPMVVSDCGDVKCILEFKFDETDFRKLMPSK